MKTCIINVDNEVTCNLAGLEANDRRNLVRMFEYYVPGAKYLPSVKLGRWDGKVSFFSLGGTTYINLLSKVIPYLESKGYTIELNDQRSYETYNDFDFGTISEDSFNHIMWPSGHPLEGKPIMLRDYQTEIVNNFLNNRQSVQVAATGSGKTIITASLSSVIEKLGRTIVIVPSKNLVTQTEADYKNMQLDVGVYFGDRKEYGHKHTITTWQSLWNIVKNSNNPDTIHIDEFIDGVVCVICDEAHSVNADVLKNMLSSVLAKIPLRYGLTGTIPKEEYAGTAITSCIGPVISKLTASELQDKGVLANCNIEILQFQDDMNFKTYHEENKYLMNDQLRLVTIADHIKKIAKTGNTLVLVDKINAGEIIVSNIPNSVFVNGSVKLSERQEQYDEVSVSDDKIIVATFGVAAVGINIVRIHNLILIEPGKSFVRVIQSIGRGLRKGFDKDSVNIYDVTSNCKFSKRHLTQRKAFYRESNYPFTLKKVSYKPY
jgi:superfamily II DNA or RNA helicase